MFHDRIDDVMKWVEMENIYNAIVDSDEDNVMTSKVVAAVRLLWMPKAMRSNHLNFFRHRCSSSEQ